MDSLRRLVHELPSQPWLVKIWTPQGKSGANRIKRFVEVLRTSPTSGCPGSSRMVTARCQALPAESGSPTAAQMSPERCKH
jgi:hypothetical protein